METSIISEQTIAILRQMFRPPQDRQKQKTKQKRRNKNDKPFRPRLPARRRP